MCNARVAIRTMSKGYSITKSLDDRIQREVIDFEKRVLIYESLHSLSKTGSGCESNH